MPNVSIIIPCYNGEKVIGRCLESVLKQEYQDIEVIVCNDGSSDRSKEIIDEFAAKDDRIVAIHKPNSGVSATRNLAISKATGKYLQFIDCDDWLPTDATKLFVRMMEENDVDLVVGDFYRVVDDNVTIRGSISEQGVLTRNEFADKMMNTPADFYYGVLWNKLYKREIIIDNGIKMDENIKICEDMIFNLEYLLHVNNISILKSPIYYYVKTPGSLVEQSLTIQKTIDMKTNVIKYYNNFYKSILSETDYIAKTPRIYAYLFAFSQEAFTIPFLTSTKKLGKENDLNVYYNKNMSSSLLMGNYLSKTLLDKYLSVVAQQFKLDIKEALVLYTLFLADEALNFDEISSYCDLTFAQTLLAITSLVASGKIKRSKEEGFDYFVIVDQEVIKALANVQEDCDGVRFKDMSEQDIQEYNRLQNLVLNNMKQNFLDK